MYYRACMNETKIEELKAKPLMEMIERVSSSGRLSRSPPPVPPACPSGFCPSAQLPPGPAVDGGACLLTVPGLCACACVCVCVHMFISLWVGLSGVYLLLFF